MSTQKPYPYLHRHNTSGPDGHLPPPAPKVVLQELFDLFEEYAPVWYTETQRDRVVAALEGHRRDRIHPVARRTAGI